MTATIERDWTRTLRHFGDLSEQVLAGLLDMRGTVEPRTISPRSLWPAAPAVWPPETLEQLVEGGVLTQPVASSALFSAGFARAADVLLAPRVNVNLRIWTTEQRLATNVLFPRNIPDGGGVATTPVGQACRVTGFVEADDLWRLAQEAFLDAVRTVERTGFETHLTASLAAALFGVADLARKEALRRLADGTYRPVTSWTAAQVSDYVRDRWGVSELDELLAAAVVAGAYETPPTPEDVAAALNELVSAGVLIRTDGAHRPGPELHELVCRTLVIERGLQWQRVALVVPGELALVHRIVLAAGKSLLLAFDRSVAGKVLVHAVSHEELANFLAAEMTTALPVQPTAGEVAGAGDVCANCRRAVPVGARFCPHCGSVQ